METKIVKETKTISTGVMGIKKDITIECQGKRIVSIDFKCKSKAVSFKISGIDIGKLVGGRGNAYIIDNELPDIKVHLWADLYTEIIFDLTVEIEI